MPTTSVELPKGLKERIEKKVEKGEYLSNSDFVRYAVRKILDEEDSLSPEAIEELKTRMNYSEEDLIDLNEG